MLVAAAVLPHPPLLVPSVGVGLGAEIETLRTDCAQAVAGVLACEADVCYVVGAGVGRPAMSFAPWAPAAPGVAERIDVPEPLPLPLLVGGWLTRGAPRSFVVVDPDTDSAECAGLGAELAATADRVTMIVMGDGSARHDVKAPGYVDDRAAAWDRTAQQAFASIDVDALLALDPGLAAELLCAGRPAWQVLAGAVSFRARSTTPEPATWRATAVLSVPFGVGYHLVTWT